MRHWVLASVLAGALSLFASDGEVAGRVTDAANFAACARVELVNLAEPSTVLSTRTDSEGSFRFSGVTAGRYSLRVAALGFLEVQRTAIDVTDAGYHEDFVLKVADCHCEGPVTVDDPPAWRPVLTVRDLYLVSDVSRFNLRIPPPALLKARFGKRMLSLF